MRCAVVDTGSNTIRMSVYEYENKCLTELFTEAIFANLAGYIVDNELTHDGILACCDALKKHYLTAQKYNCDFYAFATAAIRNAKNRDQIVKEIKKITNIDLDILSGTDEGELSFLGAFEDFSKDTGVMADVGGGSSEIVVFKNGKITTTESIPIGSLKAYKTFVGGTVPTIDEANSIKEEIKKYLVKNEKFKNMNFDTLCLTGGGIRSAKKLSGVILNNDNLVVSGVDKMLSLLIENPKTFSIVETLVPKRKLTVGPALAIYSSIGEFFGAEKIQTSDKGIKEGYVLKYLVH